MRRILTLSAFLLCSKLMFAQSPLLAFNFSGTNGQSNTYTSTTTAASLTVSTISRGSGIAKVNQANTYSSSGFSSSSSLSTSNNEYVQFTLTPKTGFKVNIVSLNIYVSRTTASFGNGGPTKLVVRTSKDNYGSNATSVLDVNSTNTSSPNLLSFPFSGLTNITNAITFRIYGYSAENSSGILYIGGVAGDDIYLEGAGQAATLPVTFTGLAGKKTTKGTELTWSVAGEVNVKEYEVERSTNSRSGFAKIGSVPAIGNVSYTFTDASLQSSIAFYRIKNIDNDGQFKYSSVLSLKSNASSGQFSIYPTVVAANKTTVQHPAAKGASVIRLSTVDGKLLKTVRPEAGAVQTEVDLSGLKAGLYLILWSNGNGSVETAKLIKQ